MSVAHATAHFLFILQVARFEFDPRELTGTQAGSSKFVSSASSQRWQLCCLQTDFGSNAKFVSVDGEAC